MTFADDVDDVRAYVRGSGRVDFVRLRQLDSALVEVVFSSHVDRHAAALAALVADVRHVRVVAGPLSGHRAAELAERYWDERRRREVLAAWVDGTVHELAFSFDEKGPFLAIGVRPHTQAAVDAAVAAFAPYRVETVDGPDVVPT